MGVKDLDANPVAASEGALNPRIVHCGVSTRTI